MPIETISSPGASLSGRTSGRCALFDRADARSARFNFTADEGDRFRRDGKVETIEAPYLRRRSEPGELALGELARRKYPAIAQFVAIDLSLEKLPYLPISDAAHRRQARPQRVAFAQRTQLLDEPAFKHRVEAFFDASMQRAAIGRNESEFDEAEGEGRRFSSPEQLRHRLSTDPKDLECPLDALRIGGFQPRGGFRIDAGKLRVQRLRAALRRRSIDVGAHLGVGFGQIGKSFAQRLEVKHGAPDEQRDPPTRCDFPHQAQRVFSETGGRIRLGRVDDVDQVVGHRGALRDRGLGRAEVHVAIHLRRVDAHHFERKHAREIEGKPSLTACGRPHQHDRRRRLAGCAVSGLQGKGEHLGGCQRPRKKSLSRSARLIWYQVGRPWLHCPERSVSSISRSRAFISGIVKARLARTAPWQAIVPSSSSRRSVSTRLAPYSRMSRNTARASSAASASASMDGTARTASANGDIAATSKPNWLSVEPCSSTVATSTRSAWKVEGISSFCVFIARESSAALSFS